MDSNDSNELSDASGYFKRDSRHFDTSTEMDTGTISEYPEDHHPESHLTELVSTDNSSNTSLGASDTNSMTTDDWAAITTEPDYDFSTRRPDYLHFPIVPREKMILVPDVNVSSGNSRTELETEDARKASINFNEVKLGQTTRVKQPDQRNTETGSANILQAMSTYDPRQQSSLGLDRDDRYMTSQFTDAVCIPMAVLPKESDLKPICYSQQATDDCMQGACAPMPMYQRGSNPKQVANPCQDDCHRQGEEMAIDQSDGYLKPTNNQQFDTKQQQQGTCLDLNQSDGYLSPIDHPSLDTEAFQQGTMARPIRNENRTAVHKNPYSYVSDPRPPKLSPAKTIDKLSLISHKIQSAGTESKPEPGNVCDTSLGYEEVNTHTGIPERPLPPRPISDLDDSKSVSRLYRSSATEHTYSRISDYFLSSGPGGLAVADAVSINENPVAEEARTANEYEKLDLTRREGCRVNCKLLPYIASVLAGVAILGMIWILRDYGFFSSKVDIAATPLYYSTETECPSTTAEVVQPKMTSVRTFVGGNASIFGGVQLNDPDFSIVCVHNHNKPICMGNRTHVQYANDQMEKKIQVHLNKDSFEFVLTNAAKVDSGIYICQLGELSFASRLFVEDGSFTRRYTGEHATLLWNIPEIDTTSPFICADSRQLEIIHLMNTYLFTSPGVIMVNDSRNNNLGFTLFNVTMQNAGKYECFQDGMSSRIGTIFIWGKPSVPKITQDGFRMICQANSTSNPESARPKMTFIWQINDSPYVAEWNESHLIISVEYWRDRELFYSCQGKEEYSDYFSDPSDKLSFDPKGFPKPAISATDVQKESESLQQYFLINCSITELPSQLDLRLLVVSNASNTSTLVQSARGSNISATLAIDCLEFLLCQVTWGEEVVTEATKYNWLPHICSPETTTELPSNSKADVTKLKI